MAFWWVNHKQTYRQETDGGYVWSPKAKANGARNVSYDNLTVCERGDVVFSYAYGRISQIGLVETAAVTAAKPPEFGAVGGYWEPEGWLVRVNLQPLRQALVPQTFFELLQPLLPERHSPINTSTGRGNQGVYLAGLGEALGQLLLKLIEEHADAAVRVHLVVLAEEGDAAAALLDDMQRLRDVPSSTERDALTKARLGQGLFRHRVAELEPTCRMTGLARLRQPGASERRQWPAALPPCGQTVRSPLDQLRCRRGVDLRARRRTRGVAVLGDRGGEPDPALQPGAGAVSEYPPGGAALLTDQWHERSSRRHLVSPVRLSQQARLIWSRSPNATLCPRPCLRIWLRTSREYLELKQLGGQVEATVVTGKEDWLFSLVMQFMSGGQLQAVETPKDKHVGKSPS
jgi:putative restriction endonuclease